MYNFKKKTWAVIDALQEKLQTTGSYPTLGHFYREIELLKFPHLAKAQPGSYYYSSHGRNVYAGSQYDNIVDYCRAQGWISIITGSKSYTVSSLIYRKSATCPEKTECIINPELHRKLHASEKIHTEFKDFSKMEVSLALDPDLEWIIKTVNGKTYLSVKK
jgi:hypothetical protein